MASTSKILDLFPNVSQNNLEQISFDQNKKAYKELAIKKRVTAFRVCIVKQRILMYLMPRDWGRLTMQNYLDNFKKCFVLEKFQPEKCIWDNIEKKLVKSVFKGKEQNSDIRTCYRIDNNTFLVKSSFTFGQRTVERGYVHFIQTTTVPMLFYRLDKQRKTKHEPCRRESCFLAVDEMCYDKFILQPNTLYEVPQKTVYVLIAVQKTLFSLHVASRHSQLARGESPFQHKKFIQNPYNLIPETPLPAGRSTDSEESHPKRPRYMGVFQVPEESEYSEMMPPPAFPLETLEMMPPPHPPFSLDTRESMPPPFAFPLDSREVEAREIDTREIDTREMDTREVSPSPAESIPEITPLPMEIPAPPSPVIMTEQEFLRNLMERNQILPQKQEIVFQINPTRWVRGVYDYPKPDDPPHWLELENYIRLNPTLSEENGRVAPLDLSMNRMPDDAFIPITPLHLDENAIIDDNLNNLFKEFEGIV